jgi:hypothetical protein
MPRASCPLVMIYEVVKVGNGVYVENQARSRATLEETLAPSRPRQFGLRCESEPTVRWSRSPVPSPGRALVPRL